MEYSDLNYLTPESFKGKYIGKRFLIIGSGNSTKKLISYKDKIRSKFDIVIGINETVFEFEEQMDYHFIIEKNPTKIYSSMKNGIYNYRRDLPRVLNWKAIQYFPEDIIIYKVTRNRFDNSPNVQEYSCGDVEGLLIGPPDPKGLSMGTASMQALHLACIMGSTEIYLIGVDLVFKDEYDHFYPDNLYRNSKTKKANRSPIVKVQFEGKEHESTQFFVESAKYIDKIVRTECNKHGINVFDFSDGLLTVPKKLNIGSFFGAST